MRNLAILYKVLMCQWAWHFAKERRALWHIVVCRKYREEEDGWCSCEVRGVHGAGVWKAIRMDWHVVGSRVAFVVGNVRRVRF